MGCHWVPTFGDFLLHKSGLLLLPSFYPPWEIVLQDGGCEVANGAISEAVRGLEVGQQLPRPHSQTVHWAPTLQGVSSVSNLIEIYLQG